MGQRLLLVDSDRSFLKEHQVSLEAAFDLDVAGSPESVVSRLESGAFAAVFICVEVADNKGYALCSTIRKNARLDGVKIALISAKATEEEYRRHQSLKGRADLYLHKPIAPSALVAALAPLVPGRTLDPDNPLGELVDTELGDDWLDGLRSALDGPAALDSVPIFGVRPPAPVPVPAMDSKAAAPMDTARLRLLEDQVAAMHQELQAKDQSLSDVIQRLAAADQGRAHADQRLVDASRDLADAKQRLQAAETEAQQVQRQLNSVTLNLDELERSNRESEALKARLAETEAALRGLEESRGRDGESAETLKAQLREALTERTDLIQQVETLNQQVGEKAQRAIELLKERDRLLHDNLDLEPYKAKAEGLEAHLAARDEALAAKQGALETTLEAQSQLHATIEGLVEQHASLEGIHQAALLELAGQREKARTYQMEIEGLEATMRSQGRDLGELGARLRQGETEREAIQAQLGEREQQLAAGQVALQLQQDEVEQLKSQLAELCQELDEANIQHEGERLELMNGLDQKEAEIFRLNQVLSALQETQGTLERDKEALMGQLSGHRDRLQTLDGLFQAVQEQIRRGSDLTRG